MSSEGHPYKDQRETLERKNDIHKSLYPEHVKKCYSSVKDNPVQQAHYVSRHFTREGVWLANKVLPTHSP